MKNRPQYLYKILSVDDWDNSRETLHLPKEDAAFVHFSTEEQLPRIEAKYWSHIPVYMVLKVDANKLLGRLVLEANPGGTTEYYHLYDGSIPKGAVVTSTIKTPGSH